MPKPFPFVTDGTHGDVPINFYPTPDSERGVLLEPSPGLLEFCDLTNCTEIRGMYDWGSYMYIVAKRGSKSPVYKVDGTGTYSEIGEITTSSTGPVTFAENPTQLGICDGVWVDVYTPTTGALVPIADTDFEGAGGITYQDGYGLVFKPDSTKWGFTGIYDFTAIDALDFYTQRARNDNITGIMSHQQQVWLLGPKAFEVWYNAGGDNSSADNPTFALYKDGVKDVGLGAPGTLNGTEGAAVSWISDKRSLIVAVGFNPTAISNQMFSRALYEYADFTDATSFSYTDNGHIFVQYNFPTGDATWVYDFSTKMFHKKQSMKTDYTFGRHRANCYCFFNGKHYVGDYENGKIYEMSTNYLDDAGNPIRREIYTTPTDTGLTGKRHGPISLTVEPGVGLEDGLDPQVMMQYSNDLKTWSSEIWRSAGVIGKYGYRQPTWYRVGSSRVRQYHFAMTDPVVWRVLGYDDGIS